MINLREFLITESNYDSVLKPIQDNWGVKKFYERFNPPTTNPYYIGKYLMLPELIKSISTEHPELKDCDMINICIVKMFNSSNPDDENFWVVQLLFKNSDKQNKTLKTDKKFYNFEKYKTFQSLIKNVVMKIIQDEKSLNDFINENTLYETDRD